MTEKQERLKLILGNLSLLIDSLYDELGLKNQTEIPEYSEVLEFSLHEEELTGITSDYDEVFEG